MQSVGTRLREARERQGLSLDEINVRTRINPKNLVAIEHDEVSSLSSPFFYRSFVRQYAREVGLDFQVIAPGVDLLAGHMRQPDLPGQGEHQPVRVAPIQPRLKRDFSWIVPAVVFVAAIALGSGGYAAWKFYKPLRLSQNSAVSSVVPSRLSLKPVVKQVPTQTPVRLTAHAPLPPVAPAVASSKPAPETIHLELAAVERTWLSVSADGKTAYTGILEPAQVKILDSRESARLRTGNAGGVNIVFNGKAIGAIGPRGKTRTIVFTKTGYEIESFDGAKLTPANHIGG